MIAPDRTTGQPSSDDLLCLPALIPGDPPEYTSAVSMKFTARKTLSRTRKDVGSSAVQPNCIVPRHSSNLTPVRPSWRNSIAPSASQFLSILSKVRQQIVTPLRPLRQTGQAAAVDHLMISRCGVWRCGRAEDAADKPAAAPREDRMISSAHR
jgi:hypothetical protein